MERSIEETGDAPDRAVAARGTNSVQVLPHDAASIRQFINPFLERVSASEGGIRGLVLAADSEEVMRIARVASNLAAARKLSILPITSAQRGARAIRTAIPTVVIASPLDLLELVRGAIVKLHGIRAVVFAWANELLENGDETLSSLVSELPKDASRTLVASRLTSEVESFAERYVRRAVRSGIRPEDEPASLPLSVVTTAEVSKPLALRRVLDVLDPVEASVFVKSSEAAELVASELRALGAASGGVTVTTEAEPATGELLVLYDLPANAAELSSLAAGGALRGVALARPRELAHLRQIAGTERVEPLALPDAGRRARASEDRMRKEVGDVLRHGLPSRELLALEPMLEEHDPIEVAAALLVLLERERASGSRSAAVAPSAQPAATRDTRSAGHGSSARLFINIGARDGATAGDFVGTLVKSADVPAAQIGKIEVRESHTLVEVPADQVNEIARALHDVTIRGRRVSAREDRAPGSSGPPRGTDRGRGGGRDSRQAGRSRGDQGGARKDRRSGSRAGSDRPSGAPDRSRR